MARTVHVAEHGARWIGNPYYLAPEQFHAEAVFASDVYGVGVVLYQMLTGSLPYQDSDPERQRALVEAGGNEHPRRQVPSVSTDLDAVVAKALAPRVSNRYPNAESMLSDLRELASFGPPPEERQGGHRPDPGRGAAPAQLLELRPPPSSGRNALRTLRRLGVCAADSSGTPASRPARAGRRPPARRFAMHPDGPPTTGAPVWRSLATFARALWKSPALLSRPCPEPRTPPPVEPRRGAPPSVCWRGGISARERSG